MINNLVSDSSEQSPKKLKIKSEESQPSETVKKQSDFKQRSSPPHPLPEEKPSSRQPIVNFHQQINQDLEQVATGYSNFMPQSNQQSMMNYSGGLGGVTEDDGLFMKVDPVLAISPARKKKAKKQRITVIPSDSNVQFMQKTSSGISQDQSGSQSRNAKLIQQYGGGGGHSQDPSILLGATLESKSSSKKAGRSPKKGSNASPNSGNKSREAKMRQPSPYARRNGGVMREPKFIDPHEYAFYKTGLEAANRNVGVAKEDRQAKTIASPDRGKRERSPERPSRVEEDLSSQQMLSSKDARSPISYKNMQKSDKKRNEEDRLQKEISLKANKEQKQSDTPFRSPAKDVILPSISPNKTKALKILKDGVMLKIPNQNIPFKIKHEPYSEIVKEDQNSKLQNNSSINISGNRKKKQQEKFNKSTKIAGIGNKLIPDNTSVSEHPLQKNQPKIDEAQQDTCGDEKLPAVRSNFNQADSNDEQRRAADDKHFLPPINLNKSQRIQKSEPIQAQIDRQIVSRNKVRPEEEGASADVQQRSEFNQSSLKNRKSINESNDFMMRNINNADIRQTIKKLGGSQHDFLKSLKMKKGYTDFVMDENGKVHINKVTLQNWIHKELTSKEVKNGLKRLYDKYPLYNLNLIEVFPALNRVKLYLNKYICKKGNQNRESANQKVQCQSQINFVDHIQQKLITSVYDRVQNNEYEQMLELEPKILHALQNESKTMDSQNQINEAIYDGTDPVEDAKRMYKEELLSKLKLQEKIVAGKKTYVSIDKEIKKNALIEVFQEFSPFSTNNQLDPYLIFGHGVLAFFRMIRYMICTFMVISVLAAIIMYLYSTERYAEEYTNSTMDAIKVSNIDGAETNCYQHHWIKTPKVVEISCRSSMITKMFHVGVIPDLDQANAENAEFLQNKNFQIFNNFCGHIEDETQQEDPLIFKAQQMIQKCSDILNRRKLVQDFNENCMGKSACQFDPSLYILDDSVLSSDFPQQCKQGFAKIFFQYQCQVGEDSVSYHQMIGLFVSQIAVLISFIYFFSIYYLLKTSKLNMKLWDFNTVTSGDFTVEMRITEQMWTLFQQNKKDQIKNEDLHFKDFLRQQIKSQMDKYCPQLNISSHAKDENCGKFNIAAIFLIYDNKKLMTLMKKRGKLLAKAELEQALNCDRAINSLLNDKVYSQQLKRPVTAFITFNDQQDQAIFLELFATEKSITDKVKKIRSKKVNGIELSSWQQFNIFGEYPHCKQALEPTSYYWENLPNTFMFRLKRIIGCLIIAISLLIFIMFLVLLLKTLINQGTERFPNRINCDQIKQSVGNDTDLYIQFVKYDKPFTLGGEYSTGLGYYQCHCSDLVFTNITTLYEDENLCLEYNKQYLQSTIFKYLVSIIIVVLNSVIKVADIQLVKKIGLINRSQEISLICIAIFLSQYFNTALVLTLSYTNIFGGSRNSGFSDFTHDWYNVVGETFVTTMGIQAFMPYVTLSVGFLTLWIKRYMDSGVIFVKDITTTKSKTVQQFIETHTGPEQQLHYRYATILNQIFVTFTYGLTMPIMFPILTVSLINMYICEKIQFAYLYRKPPLLDNKLNELALKALRFAPVIMFMTGFWQFGNRQIFFDEVNQKEMMNDNQESEHAANAFNFFSKGIVDHTAVYFFYSFFFIAFPKLVKYTRRALAYYSKFQKQKISKKERKQRRISHQIDAENADDMNIDENLDSYWECLPGQDQKRWFTKESHLRKQLNIKQLDDDNFEKLRTTKRRKQYISNVVNYDILFCLDYADKLFYTHMGRRVENETSDAICQLLYEGEEVADTRLNKTCNMLFSTKNFMIGLMKKELRGIQRVAQKQQLKGDDDEDDDILRESGKNFEGKDDDDKSDSFDSRRVGQENLQTDNFLNFEIDIDGFE